MKPKVVEGKCVVALIRKIQKMMSTEDKVKIVITQLLDLEFSFPISLVRGIDFILGAV